MKEFALFLFIYNFANLLLDLVIFCGSLFCNILYEKHEKNIYSSICMLCVRYSVYVLW